MANGNWTRNKTVLAIMPILLGVAAFFLVVGPRVLDPMNIGWLQNGDPATHYLGWHFFRTSEWSFPVGLNPDYGLELSNAIIFSDSNPLLAIIFKPIAYLLPDPFQYFGFWLLGCFVLQAWFGWKIVSLISDNAAIRLLGAGFFAFAPPMIWRLHGHLSLVGHFLVVAALYLALRPMRARRALSWGVLLVVTALVHAYLLAMVAALWLADLVGRKASADLPIGRIVGEFATLVLSVGIVCWQVGYFSAGSGLGQYHGYGVYRMNLLSVVDPSGWSYVLTDFPEAIGDYEGFNFLGLGFILLLLFAIPGAVSGHVDLGSAIRRKIVLLCVLVGLTVFAVSNKIGIGIQNIAFPLPEVLLRAADVFRASGRMFWPAFYALLTSVIFVVVRGHDKRTAIFLLALALLVQVVDTSAQWMGFRDRLMVTPSSQWATPLQDRFWAEAASRYRKIRWLPPGNLSPHWQTLAAYAGRYGLATDAVYLARVDQSALEAARAESAAALASGRYQPDSLYVLDATVLGQAMRSLDRNTDLLARIDGLDVYAPGWKKCADCPAVDGELRVADVFPPLEIGQRVEFSQAAAHAGYLVAGWTLPGAGETPWSEGPAAEVALPLTAGVPVNLLIEANALVAPSHPKQDIEIRVNGTGATTVRLTRFAGNRIEVPIPEAASAKLAETGILRLEFRFPDAVTPKDIGMNADTRSLALNLLAITVN